MEAYDTLSQATTAYHQKGYTYEFSLESDGIKCAHVDKKFDPNNFTIVQVFRFEGMSSTDDSSVLYIIESSDGTKGQLIDAYGAYAENVSPEMAKKLSIKRD